MHTSQRSTVVAAVIAVLATGSGLGPVTANAQDLGEIEEITVTAQKREENLQDVPISVAAFTSDMIERVGNTNIVSVNGIAPNIVLQTQGLVPNVPMFSIRGMNHSDPDPNSDPKTSMIIDGVYVPFVAATLLDMFDIDRVEILRGPQGTLFGKNNLAGTVNVITARPTGEFGGKVSVTVGENGLAHYKFKVDTAAFANETMTAKIAGAYRTYDGYATNVSTGSDLNGQEVSSWRGALAFEPSDEFDVRLVVDYTDDSFDGPAGHGTGVAAIMGNGHLAALNFDPTTDTESTGVSLEANWSLGEGQLTAVYGYRELDYFNRGDFDGTPLPGVIPQQNLDVGRDFTGDTSSLELRYANSIGENFDFVAGIYYSEDEWTQVNDVKVFDAPVQIASFGTNQQEGESFALFAQGDIYLSDRWTLTLGARYTEDEKSYSLASDSLTNGTVTRSFFAQKNDTWNNFSPRVAVEFAATDETLYYATISEGYKGGGYNSRATLPELVGPYDEETVTAYEAGMKSDLLDGRMRLNMAVFRNEYEDLQVSVQRPGAIRAESITTNVAKAEISGIEFETLFLPADNFQIGLNLGFMDSKYSDFCDDTNGASAYMPSNCGGFELEFAPGQWLIAEDQTHLDLANAPDFSASLLLDYDILMSGGSTINLHGDVRYTDKYNTWGRSNDPLFYRDSVALVNANITFNDADDRYSLSAYVRNLTDEEVISGAVATGTNPITQFFQSPREVGVEFIYFF